MVSSKTHIKKRTSIATPYKPDFRKRLLEKKKRFLLLISDKSIREIANIVGVHESNIRRTLYKFRKLGLITAKRKPTPEGLEWLNFQHIEVSKTHIFRLHNLQFVVKSKLPIGHDVYDKIEKVFGISNIWNSGYVTFREFNIGTVRTRVVGDTFCFYIPEIIAESPAKAKEKALDILWKIMLEVEQKLAIELYKTPEMVITVGSQHIALMNEPLAHAFIKAGIKLRVEDINGQPIAIIDDSKGYKELEFVNWKTAEMDIAKIRDMYFDITRNNAWQNMKEEIEKLKKEVEFLKKNEKKL